MRRSKANQPLTSIEELPGDKFLNAKLLHSHTNEADVVTVENWFHTAQLTGCQPAVGSSKPPEEGDHARTRCPKRLQRDRRICRGALHNIGRDVG